MGGLEHCKPGLWAILPLLPLIFSEVQLGAVAHYFILYKILIGALKKTLW